MKTSAPVLFVVAVAALTSLTLSAHAQTTYSPFGNYTQTSTYFTTVQPPINADNSSVWPAKKAGVVPVKFTLSVGLGDLTITSASAVNPAYGGVSFTIPAGLTLNNMMSLNYTGTTVGCGAGSPRFVLDYGNGEYVVVYIGGETSPGDPNSGCENYAGGNLLTSTTATRFEDTTLNAQVYVTRPTISATYGDVPIQGMWLVTDNGNSSVTLASVNIQGATYTFATSTPTATCTLPAATIALQQIVAPPAGTIDETVYSTPADTGNNFRIDGCQYIYNLDTKKMSAGTYKVFANVGGNGNASKGGQFALK